MPKSYLSNNLTSHFHLQLFAPNIANRAKANAVCIKMLKIISLIKPKPNLRKANRMRFDN